MSLIKLNRNRFPWNKLDVLDTDGFFFDDFFIKENLPAMNVKDNKSNYEIELALPGFTKKDIDVTIDDALVHIHAEKESEEKEEKKNYTRQEFSYDSFDRSFQLPMDAKSEEKIKAAYKDGILTLTVNKKKDIEAAKKVIDVQ